MKQLKLITFILPLGRMAITLLLLLAVTDVFGQQSSNVLAASAQLDMEHIPIDVTVSRAAIARNDQSTPITIRDIGLVCGNAPFHYTASAKLPLILQPGDTVVLGLVSYTPYRANEEYVGYLIIGYSPKRDPQDGEVRLHASSIVDSSLLRPCMSLAWDSSVFGPVLYGGSVTRTLSIHNNLDTARTIRCIDFTIEDRDRFSCPGKQFPLTVPAGATANVLVKFTAPNDVSAGDRDFFTDALIEPMGNGDECQPDIRVRAMAFIATSPTTVTSITDTTAPLGMYSSEWQFSRDFAFENTTGHEIVVDNAGLESEGAAMSLSSLCGAELPVTLAPGDRLKARINFTAQNSEVHYDRLLLETEQLGTFAFGIQAIRLAPSSVRNGLARRQIALKVTPNPSSASFAIELSAGYRGDMAIYSSLGQLVAETKNTSAWNWKATYTDTSKVPAGDYTLRVTCHDTDGTTLTRTERLVVLKD